MSKRDIAFSANAIHVAQANPGLDFTKAQLQALDLGDLVAIPGATFINPRGINTLAHTCIKFLRYDGDEELTRVAFESGHSLQDPAFPGSGPYCVNLKDFREQLQTAANFGHGVSYCYNSATQKMTMLNIFPCECDCGCDDKR